MIRVLSIDGGGVKGVIPARILRNIENDHMININNDKYFLYNNFNSFAGSSVGSMIICAIAYNKSTGEELNTKYLTNKNIKELLPNNYDYIGLIVFAIIITTVFMLLGFYVLPMILCDKKVGSFIGSFIGLLISVILIFIVGVTILFNTPRYSENSKIKVIDKFSDRDTSIRNNKDVLITSYNMSKQESKYFKSWDDEDKDVKLREALDASSAVPGLYPAVKINNEYYIDGGVSNINPTACIYSEMLNKYPGKKIKILSLGCGYKKKINVDHDIKSWGQLKWISSGNIELFIGNEQDVDKRVKSFSKALGDTYLRINGELEKSSMTDTNIYYLNSLKDVADKWYKDYRTDIINFFNEP